MNHSTSSFFKKKSTLITLLTITILLSILSLLYLFTPNHNTFHSSSADAAFECFTEEIFVNEVSSSSLVLHYTLLHPLSYNITEEDVSFGSFSTNTDQTKSVLQNYLLELSTYTYDQLSHKNQLTYDILFHYFDHALSSLPYHLYDEPLTPYTGLHSQLPILLSEFPLTCENDITIYLKLLSTLPDYFDSLLNYQHAKAKAGLFMSNSRLSQVLSECDSFISMEDNYLISTFNERISKITDLNENQVHHYQSANQALVSTTVIDAYESLMIGLQQLKGCGSNELGLCYYDGGRAYYSDLVANSTGSSRSIPDIKLLIENQINRDLTNYESALTSSAALTTPSLIEDNPEDILQSLQDSSTYSFPDGPSVNTIVKEVPTDLEPFLSPAFYLIPPIDDASKNTIYINQSQMHDPLTLYTTLAHEGYPGHLYQTTYYANSNPDPIRSLLDYGGYTEGWAIYAEMCSYYLSDLPTNTATLEQTNSSIMLGLYCLTDIGIHYEGWDLFDTIDFYHSYKIDDTTAVRNIYDLVLATPSNYLKYYVGYLEFLELKKECIAKWGDEFSQIRFHKKVLDIGPAPFDILHEYTILK